MLPSRINCVINYRTDFFFVERLIIVHLFKSLSAVYQTRMFITVPTRDHKLSG
jgi:hypothetical protein